MNSDRFVNNISISPAQDAILLSARKKIRQAIKSAFRDARSYLLDQEGIQDKDIELISKILPKFMTQGSYAYKTLNSPCYASQEIDLDDGVYLPMSLIDTEPKAKKEWFFAIVDGALRELAKREGWKFSGKDTCARVILSGQQAHVDIPLYAIPDERHAALVEAMAAISIGKRKLSDVYFDDSKLLDNVYLLDKDKVFLATRENGWKKSDPLLIANWFKQEILVRGAESGKRLRRVCRFLKAWRDCIWEKGGPSSLTLMICAVRAYPNNDNNRDDYALLEVVKKLPGLLSREVSNPAVGDEADEEVVYPRDDINKEEVVGSAQALCSSIELALSGSLDKTSAIQKFTEKFGDRMPKNIDWIEEIGSAAIVRATPAATIKPEIIPNSKSG